MNVLLTQYLEIPLLKRKRNEAAGLNTSGENGSLLMPSVINSLKVIHNWLLSFLLPPTNKVWGKVIFSEACVKNSVYGGRSTWAGTPRDRVGTPPRPDSYSPRPGRYTPLLPGRYPLGTRQVHSPGTRQVPRPPSSTCWEIRATSGRYTSYWNAFLL